jgi:hypothetical protein
VDRYKHQRLGVILAVATVGIATVSMIGADPREANAPAVALVEETLRLRLRSKWVNVRLRDSVLEIKVAAQAVKGEVRPPSRVAIDTRVVRAIAGAALELYAPQQLVPRPDLYAVEIRVWTDKSIGPISMHGDDRVFTFPVDSLRLRPDGL